MKFSLKTTSSLSSASLREWSFIPVRDTKGERSSRGCSTILAVLSQIGGVERPGIVHRLDKETSGCLVVAKTDSAHRSLAAQFAGREVGKVYLALVSGTPRRRSGVVDAPISRHPVNRKKMVVCAIGRGRPAVTEYRVLCSAGGVTLVECRPRTGRTHQIRVHLKHLGCPVLGDPLYGRRGSFSRHMLHAWKLEFRHPFDGRLLAFEAAPPRSSESLDPMSERLTLAAFHEAPHDSACHLPVAEYARLHELRCVNAHGITLKQKAAALAVDGGAH